MSGLTPEGRVKLKLKKNLADGGYFQYWPVTVGYGSPMVDCLAWRDGASYAIEVKRPGATKPTPRQATIMRMMRAKGVQTFVVTADVESKELIWIQHHG